VLDVHTRVGEKVRQGIFWGRQERMSRLFASAKPYRIKAAHRRRRKCTSGQSVQRYYDPGIGRFLSVDPVTADGNTGGNFNRYWYANNNPYKFTDPDGRTIDFAPNTADGFKSTINASFAEMDTTTAGHAQLEQLRDSSHAFIFSEKPGASVSSPNSSTDARKNGVGTGGTTHMDPSHEEKYDSTRRDNQTASMTARVAHEVAHLSHFDKGTVPNGKDGREKEELNARKDENKVRTELHQPIRKLH